MGTMNLEQLMDYIEMENLKTDIGKFHAKGGSDTVFDYSKGNPLASSNVGKLSKEAGAKLHFNGASGHDQLDVTGKFQKGTASNFYDAKGHAAKMAGMKNMESVMHDQHNAMKNYILLI